MSTEMKPLDASTALSSKDAYGQDLGRWRALIASKALPKHIETPEMAIAIARIGELYGWDPMRSLRSIFLVEGRPEMSAESMLSLIREKCPEAIVQPVTISPERVTIRACRPPQMPDPFEVTVTKEQFKHMIKPTRNGHPSTWMLYTEDMLWARCVSRVARRIFPDVIAGAYTIGETLESQCDGTTVHQVGTREVVVPEIDLPPEDDAIDAECDGALHDMRLG